MHSRLNAFAGLLTLVIAGAAPLAHADKGQVTHLSGVLSAKKADGTIRVLAERSEVQTGDVLTSEKNTYANIRFSDGSQMTMKPTSSVKVEKFAYQQDKPGRLVRSHAAARRPAPGHGNRRFAQSGQVRGQDEHGDDRDPRDYVQRRRLLGRRCLPARRGARHLRRREQRQRDAFELGGADDAAGWPVQPNQPGRGAARGLEPGIAVHAPAVVPARGLERPGADRVHAQALSARFI